ncbi:NADH-cytochrome b5 reductase [Cyberlindnera jadinii]|uniref:NADH-cytochrome b5 reductase n=1 Tax=Cyberlindnera jadinii (strain ATCC 18201 / CBS 1600 / BCRC 20928 / JCM 3617 / NBRC 0987 / NRRL Y-1542) TaxID=983966 RepID=A0A0H5BZW5_CYBJN|nr:NADH-cytochrome b5 reductase [Cyberlindnera jadinii]
MSLISRLTSSKFIVPVAVGTAAVAATLAFSTLRPLANEPAAAFKGDDQWIDLKLIKYEDLSHDSRKFTFALPSEDVKSGLVTASILLAKYVTPKGSNVVRPYTPVSDPELTGTIEFVIKKYPTGKFGNHIFGLKENDTVSFKGPIVKWKWTPNQFKSVTLIGGGSGITPLYQLLHQITKDPQEKTKVNLVYGSKTAEDTLLKKEIDEIAAKFPDRVNVTYFLDEASPSAPNAQVGYITKEWLAKNIPGPSADHHVYVCGPPPLYEAISGNKVSPSDQGEVTGALKELGFTKEEVFKF